MSKLTEIKAFLQISDNISTAGQPTRAEFSTIRESGHQTVINLARSDSPGALINEQEVVQALGLEYVHIPVEWDAPNMQDALRFFEVMNQHENHTVFIHCAANKRVSAFVFLYRVLCLGDEPMMAQPPLHQIWTPNPIWQAFMDQMMVQFRPRQAPSL